MKTLQNKSKDELIEIIKSLKAKEKNQISISNNELQSILSSINDLIFVIDKEQQFTYVNISKKEKLLFKPETFIGKKFKEIMPKYMHQQFDTAFNKNKKGEYTTYEYELEINKQTFYYRAGLSPIFENDKFNGSAAVISDITEQKRTELTVKEQKNKIESIFRSAPVGIGLVKNRILLHVNDRFCKISGYIKDELIHKSAEMLYPSKEDYDYAGKEKYEQIKKYGIGTVETCFKRKDGKIIDVLLSSTPIDLNDLSKGVTFTVLNISRRKKAENRYIREKDLNKKILETSTAVIVGLDQNHIIKVFNKRAEDISGYKKEDVIGKDWFKLFFTENQIKEMDIVWKKSWGIKHHSYTNPIITKSGKERIISWQTTGIYDSSNSKNHLLISFGEDITEKIKSQEKLKQSEKQFRLMFSEHNSVMLLINPDSGKIESANKSAVDFYGYSEQELLNMTIDQINCSASYKTAVNISKAKHHKQNIFIFEHKLKNKTIKTVEIHSSPINFKNKPVLFLIIHDISDKIKVEKELKENELKYGILAKYTYDWEYWIDPQGKYKYISSSCKRITGYSEKDFIDNPELLFDLVHPDYKEKVYKHYHDENNKNTPVYSCYFPIISKSGKLHWINHNCSPVFDEKGNFLGRRGNNRDVSDVKLAEFELKRQNEEYLALNEEYKATNDELKTAKEKAEDNEMLFKNIFHTVPDPMSVSTILTGKYLYINEGFTRLTGYTMNETIGNSVKEINLWNNFSDREQFIKKFQKDGSVHNFETEFKMKDGRILPGLVSANKINIQGTQHMLVITRDISKIKKAQSELKLREQKFQFLFNNLTDAVYLYPFSENGFENFIEVNDTACKMLGYTKEEFYNLSAKDISVLAAAKEKNSKEARNRFFEKKVNVFETKHITKSRKEIPVEIKSLIIELHGEKRILSIVRDITKRKKTEQELDKYHLHLENLVKERTKEYESVNEELLEANKDLEKFNELFIDREFRIKELKEKVKELEEILINN